MIKLLIVLPANYWRVRYSLTKLFNTEKLKYHEIRRIFK